MPDHRIKTLFVNITNGCNLRCIHCSVSAGKRAPAVTSMSERVFSRLIEEATRHQVKHLVFSGGEPLLHERISSMCETVLDKGFLLSISTNGMLFKPRLVEILSGASRRVVVQVSLDGDRDVHNRIRGSRVAYDRAMTGVKKLQDAALQVSLSFTLHDMNFPCLLDVLTLSMEARAPLTIAPLQQLGRGKRLAPVDTAKLLRAVKFAQAARAMKCNVKTNIPPLIDSSRVDSPESMNTACGWGRSLLGVLQDGSIRLCVLASEDDAAGGNILSTSLDDVMNNPNNAINRVRQFRTEDLKGVCAVCFARDTCGGGCRVLSYGLTHDHHAPFPLCQDLYERGLTDGRSPIVIPAD
jgi:Fe-coproporphyrin III synthase